MYAMNWSVGMGFAILNSNYFFWVTCVLILKHFFMFNEMITMNVAVLEYKTSHTSNGGM